MEVVIIGGGPAGMIAGITAAKEGNKVIILEKMNTLGRKLLITGKGRCNITSSLDISEFINNVPGNGKFLYSVFQKYTNKDILKLLNENGVATKVERGNRVFPVSDKSQDVLNALIKELNKNKVKIITKARVYEICTENRKIVSVKYIDECNNETKLRADKVILATGGKSYPLTGSTGDGYEMAKKLGHTITKIMPSLVPLECRNEDLELCKSMQGLSLKNVGMKLVNLQNGKIIYEDFGELLFTHFGVSGPTILSSSAHLLRYKNIDNLLKSGQVKLQIDLKPALDFEKLNARVLRDFEKEKNKLFKNSLDELLPKKLIKPIIKLSKINPDKQVNSITKKEREELIELIKNFTITIAGFRPIEEAIITSGGVDIKEINPKTMESKIIKNLYFAGEIIDVDAYTGGFNLQIAYSTGYVAGKLYE